MMTLRQVSQRKPFNRHLIYPLRIRRVGVEARRKDRDQATGLGERHRQLLRLSLSAADDRAKLRTEHQDR